ncbi:unnamed protein product, partial [Lymnaea stagnalis]
LLSEYEKNVFILINHVTLSSLFCLFGIVGNCINICVFVKQGLTKSMNASFFAVAISDVLKMFVQVWQNICLNPYMLQADSVLDFNGTQFLTAGTPSVLFMRITGWITMYVTAERCLSIAVPMRIKHIVTPGRRAAILVFIYVINIASAIPLYLWAYISWNFYPAQNRSRLGISFRSNKQEVGLLSSYFHSSMSIIAFVLVIIFTAILVGALVRTSKWRLKFTSKSNHKEMRERERKTVVMVSVVAAALIVCYTPAISCAIAASVSYDFSISGRQTNVYQAVWSFAFLFHSVNSSITILLYYKTSTRYKRTLQEMFPR